MLENLGTGLWALRSQTKIGGCRASLRMSVFDTGQGMAFYSPVPMDAAIEREVLSLGPVGFVIAPNLYHHMFLLDAVAMFPEARVLVPEGLAEKIGPIPRAEVMGPNTTIGAPDLVQPFVFSAHTVRETLIYHSPSATLITSDMIYNYQAEHFPAEKLFFRLAGAFGAPGLPFYHRFSVSDRKHSVQAMLDWVSARKVERLVMSHGRVYEGGDAGARFVSAWAAMT